MKQQKHKILEYEIDISQIHNPQLRVTMEKRLDDAYLFGWHETWKEWRDTGSWGDRYSESR